MNRMQFHSMFEHNRTQRSLSNLERFLTPVVFAALIVFVGPSLTYASAPGASTANFLKIGVGARADALAGAYSPISEDVSGIYWNPAALSLVHRAQFGFSYDRLVENISYQFGGCVLPIAVSRSTGMSTATPIRYGTLGAGVYYLPVNNIDAYDVRGIPIGTVDTYDLAASLSYALPCPAYENLSVGFTGKLIQKFLADKKTSGFAVDFGILFVPDRQFLGGDWRAAACIANLGTGLKFVSERNPFPLLWRLGMAHRRELLSNDLCASVQITGASDNSPYISIGLEYLVWHMFSLRVGYNSSANLDKGFRAGAGISTDLLSLDYAYVPFGVFGNTHRFTLGFKFGRKPVGIARVREMIEKHYALGRRYVQQDRLITAYREFEEVLKLDPLHDGAKTALASIEHAFSEAKTAVQAERRQKEIDEHIALGKKYFDQGDLIKARQEFETILKVEARNTVALNYLKKIEGLYQEALNQQAEALFKRGAAYFEKGKLSEAIVQWKKVLELKPEHKQAKEYIKRAQKQLEEQEEATREKLRPS